MNIAQLITELNRRIDACEVDPSDEITIETGEDSVLLEDHHLQYDADYSVMRLDLTSDDDNEIQAAVAHMRNVLDY